LSRQRWVDAGLLFPPPRHAPWSQSHAALPFVLPEDGLHRLYFSARDEDGRSSIGSALVDLDDPDRPPELSDRPALGLGELGAFDDSGVTMSWLLALDGRLLLYYTGWSLGRTVPFYLFAGLAESRDGGRSFTRLSRAPLLPRCPADPLLTASPCVLPQAGGFRMWYVSAESWEQSSEGPRHHYNLRTAWSEDGLQWTARGQRCLDFGEGEYAFGRPSVLFREGLYRMWFCVRGDRYRLGYAESVDGLKWARCDDSLELPPRAEWCSEMRAYPQVFEHRGVLTMLYNGNGFGRSGVGRMDCPASSS